jgi:hypothetical protein
MGISIGSNKPDTPINARRLEEYQMTQAEREQNTTTDDFLFSTDSRLRFNTTTSEFDDGLSTFLHMRRNLFGVAYRMLSLLSVK